MINIGFIASLVIVSLIGFMLGFGRSLKITTSGIVGVLISVLVCVMLGTTIINIDAISKIIINLNTYFSQLWSFLGYLYLGYVIYYLCFFMIVQAIRMILVKILSEIAQSQSVAIKVINKVLGAVFMCTFFFSICLLALAGLKFFENAQFALNIISSIKESFLWTIYTNNPIKF